MTLIERLDEAGIINAHVFAERGGGGVFITFQRDHAEGVPMDHPHAFGYKQYQAHAWVRVGDSWGRKIFPAFEGDSVPDMCRILAKPGPWIAVEKAQEWAGKRVGGAEWVAGPFPDSWQCKETRERVLALLDELRAS
jgi:hypothetical protein